MFGSSAVLNRRLRSKVLVTLKTGEAFDGVLWEADKDAYVLRNCTLASPSTSADPTVTVVDGELIVHTADVAYIQIP